MERRVRLSGIVLSTAVLLLQVSILRQVHSGENKESEITQGSNADLNWRLEFQRG